MQSDPKGIAAPDPPGADDAVSEYEWLPSCRLGVMNVAFAISVARPLTLQDSP